MARKAILVVSLTLLVAGAYLAICAYAASVLTVVPRTVDRSKSPAQFGLAFSDVRLPSRTPGIELAGWYLPAPDSTRALVLVHGHTSSRSAEFGGRFVELMAAMHQRGFAVLAFDLRGHGQSSDANIGFGSLEHDDVAGAIDWLRAQGFAAGRIGVLGISMGGAAAIRATADDPAVAALVADSAPAAVLEVVRQEWTGASSLPGFFLPTTLQIARLRYGIDLEAAPALAAMPRIAPRPVLLIHGLADSLIPPSNATRLADVLPGSEVWLVPGAQHASSYMADPEGYRTRVGDFFQQYIPGT
jgi:uncharacterized protein